MTKTLREIKEIVSNAELDDLSPDDKRNLIENMQDMIWEIGLLWDKLEETDPCKITHNSPRLGTANRRSMTYKLRKVARFTYP